MILLVKSSDTIQGQKRLSTNYRSDKHFVSSMSHRRLKAIFIYSQLLHNFKYS